MTTYFARRTEHRSDERGAALVAVLLLLMMLSAVATALSLSGQTETLVARNHQSAAQARAVAEAGLNHATAIVIDYIENYAANGFGSVEAVLDTMLLGPDATANTADDGSLASLPGGFALDVEQEITGVSNVRYIARVMDEEDPARGTVPTAAAVGEDGDALVDANKILVIRAVGYAQDDDSPVKTTVALEAMISPLELGAIVTGGDLSLSGNPTIAGTDEFGNPTGDVHSNGDLLVDGSTSINGNGTASGMLVCDDPCSQIDGNSDGEQPELTIPQVNAIEHKFKADFVLTSDGTMTDLDGTILCSASPCNYWNFNSANGSWTISDNNATNGTYYVEGMAKISGGPGSDASPVSLSIIAEGSIEISGNPDLLPDYPELLFVTDGDLKISGNYEQPLGAEGQILVHEQMMIIGNPAIMGQIIVEDAENVDSLVDDNTISGNATITYSGGLGDWMYSVSAWREVR